MASFIVRKINDSQHGGFHTHGSPDDGAQVLANESRNTVGVYELIKEFEPLPLTVALNIDTVLAKMENHQNFPNRAIAFGILTQLKKNGVTTLDMPPGFTGL